MASGPGKYDAICTVARETAGAQALVLIVLNGRHGSGFSVQSTRPLDPPVLVDLLQHVVDQLRKDAGQ
jgi:hypothetical protein